MKNLYLCLTGDTPRPRTSGRSTVPCGPWWQPHLVDEIWAAVLRGSVKAEPVLPRSTSGPSLAPTIVVVSKKICQTFFFNLILK